MYTIDVNLMKKFSRIFHIKGGEVGGVLFLSLVLVVVSGQMILDTFSRNKSTKMTALSLLAGEGGEMVEIRPRQVTFSRP